MRKTVYGAHRAANGPERDPPTISAGARWVVGQTAVNAPASALTQWCVFTRTPTLRQDGQRDTDLRYTLHGHRARQAQWSRARWSPPSAVGRCSPPPPQDTVPTVVRCSMTETTFGGTAPPPAPTAANTAAPDNPRPLQP